MIEGFWTLFIWENISFIRENVGKQSHDLRKCGKIIFKIGNIASPIWENNPLRHHEKKMGWVSIWENHRFTIVIIANRFFPVWELTDSGVGQCPFLRILNITLKYLLEFISPIVGWCSIGTFTNPWDSARGLFILTWQYTSQKKSGYPAIAGWMMVYSGKSYSVAHPT